MIQAGVRSAVLPLGRSCFTDSMYTVRKRQGKRFFTPTLCLAGGTVHGQEAHVSHGTEVTIRTRVEVVHL